MLKAFAGTDLGLDEYRVEALLVERLDQHVGPATGGVVFERIERLLRGDADAVAFPLGQEPGVFYLREAGLRLGLEKVGDYLAKKVLLGHGARI